MYRSEDGNKNKRRLLTAHEIKMQLERICQHADGVYLQEPISVLLIMADIVIVMSNDVLMMIIH